jgi:hypothetical protein
MHARQVAADDQEETERLGTCGAADVGAVRLAAGAALLRLARCHDARIPPLTYCALALTMQARAACARAPHRHLFAWNVKFQWCVLSSCVRFQTGRRWVTACCGGLWSAVRSVCRFQAYLNVLYDFFCRRMPTSPPHARHFEEALPSASARAQDAQLEVRAAFGARVRRTLSALLAGAVQRAAKYAALLPLAAADPRDAHRTAAHHALSEYVALRRRAAAAAAASPRAAAGSGGTVLHELPDYLLPFLLQARNPGTCAHMPGHRGYRVRVYMSRVGHPTRASHHTRPEGLAAPVRPGGRRGARR